MEETKYLGQLKNQYENNLELLKEITLLMEKYSRPDVLYVVSAYAQNIGLPGFDYINKVYKSRIQDENKKS